jgi:dihydroxy-acid dehydratase
MRNGDRIRIDLHEKRVDLLLSDKEIAARLAGWTPPEPRIKTGYMQRYVRLVQPALKGAILRVD